ncbi:MAG: beta-ketoacyl-[acyl-carrier-protein] synthase family protein [Planctomycetota bacterium]
MAPIPPGSMSHSNQRVVITGLGVVGPLGIDLETFWQNLMTGTSGITELDCFPPSPLPARFGGQARSFTGDIANFGPLDKGMQRAIKKNQKVMCREIEMGVAACQLALHHSGLSDPSSRDPERFGIVYGSDYILTRPEEYADGVRACLNEQGEFCYEKWPMTGRPQVNPLWLLKYLPNMPASHVAIYNDLRGPSNSVTIREASSGASIAEAVSTIRRGAADVMLAGATGSRLEPLRALHFAANERLASPKDNPAEMSRPYDVSRDGAIIGEGAGALVLESLERATARGAKIWGEVVASGSSSVGAARGSRDNIRLAVRNVVSLLQERSKPSGVSFRDGELHIHGCGKSEIEGDASEANGLRDALGDADVPVAAAKSYFGGLGAGSGSIEIIASCLALENDRLFPVLNTRSVDPKCPIRLAQESDSPGTAFAHLAYSSQGQASGIVVRKLVSA